MPIAASYAQNSGMMSMADVTRTSGGSILLAFTLILVILGFAATYAVVRNKRYVRQYSPRDSGP